MRCERELASDDKLGTPVSEPEQLLDIAQVPNVISHEQITPDGDNLLETSLDDPSADAKRFAQPLLCGSGCPMTVGRYPKHPIRIRARHLWITADAGGEARFAGAREAPHSDVRCL